MDKMKHIALLLIIMAVSILLTGCVEFNIHMTINKNRTADLDVTLLAPRALLAMEPELEKKYFEEKKDELASQGFTVTDYTEENVVGFQASRKLQSVEELSSLALAGELGIKDHEVFKVEKGVLTTTYHLDADIDLRDLFAEENNMRAFSTPRMRFIITLPVKPLEHNATSVTEDERTLEWTLSPTRQTHLELTARAPNLSAVIAGIVIVVAAVITLVVVIYRRKQPAGSTRKQAKSSAKKAGKNVS